MKKRTHSLTHSLTHSHRRQTVVWVCLILFSLFLIVLPACSESSAETPAPQTAPQYPKEISRTELAYKVSRVIDGDTVDIIVNNQVLRIRLIGVDTPETVDPRKPVQFYGKEASNFLTNLLKGEEVYLEYEDNAKPEYDKYNRLLAYLYRAPDGLFVNLEIVRQGYGHAYTKYPFKYMELFRAYEKRARENGKGLWAPDAGQKQDTTAPPTQPPTVKEEPKDADITVYITKTGTKYHRADCEWVARSKIPISLKDAKSKGYEPCGACDPPK